MIEYKWASGSHKKGDAQKVGERIAVLTEKHAGMLDAKDVVRDARRKSSALHSHFEWNDTAAAEEHRRHQARNLLRSIVTVRVTEKEGEEATPIRAFVAVRANDEDRGRRYTPIQNAMESPTLRQQVLQTAWRELEGWKRRYSEYNELSEVFRAMDGTERAVAKG